MLVRIPKEADLLWHCDDSFRDPQPLGSVFYCVKAPDPGHARTHFASGVQSFACLSDVEKERLRNLAAIHDYNFLNELLMKNNPDR